MRERGAKYNIAATKRHDIDEARRLFRFPEPPEIGFGYTRSGKRGSGIGGALTELLLETLLASPRLVERGIRHVEEMQLVSVGIGPDRVSDIVANVLKHQVIEYTQKQAAIWNIELQSGVPIENYFDASSGDWRSGHFDLPVNPESGDPIILVPRRTQPRKVILVLTDGDMNAMLDMKCKGTSPMRHIQRLYRQFRTSVQ